MSKDEFCEKLLLAVQTGDSATVKELLLLTSETDDQTTICWKIESNRLENNPVHLASANNDVAMLELLVASSKLLVSAQLVYLKNKALMSPIHEAVINNSLEAANFLIKFDKNFASVKGGRYGHTPLHMAAFYGYVEMVQLLLENGAKIDEENGYEDDDESGSNNCYHKIKPIHLAVFYGRTDVINLLLLENRKLLLEEFDVLGNHLLHWAAVGGHVEMVRYLVDDCGIDFDIKQQLNGNTPLHCSVIAGRGDVTAFLVERGANLDARNADGERPLQLAAFYNQAEIAQILMDAKNGDDDEATLLNYAALADNPSLLTRGVDVASLCGNHTPLHFAALSSSSDEAFENDDTDMLSPDDASLLPPVHLVAFYGQLDVLKLLLSTKPDLINKKDLYGNCLIHWAALGGQTEVLKWLIQEGKCDPNLVNEVNGYRPIHYASSVGSVDVVDVLIENGVSVMSQRDGQQQQQLAIHFAAVNGHLKTVEYFANLDATLIDICDKNNYLPVHLAVLNGHLDVVATLLERSKSPSFALDLLGGKFGRNLLHMAADKGYFDVVKFLVETKSANILATSRQGDMAIHLAVKHGHAEIVDYFLQKSSSPVANLLQQPGNQSMLPVHLAAYFGHQSVVEICLRYYNSSSSSVDQLDVKQRTPLHYAAMGGQLKMVKFLANNHGANLMARTYKKRRIPLHFAALYGHLKICEFLLLKRPDSIKAVDSDNNSVLFYAVLSGNVEVVKLLLAKRSGNYYGLEHRNSTGQSSLQLAAQLGHVDIVDTLIKARSDFDDQDDENYLVAPIHLAAYSGQVDLVKFMLDLKPDLAELEDGLGNKPIHLAALGGSMATVDVLMLRYKNNVEMRDACYGRTPLHCAAERGHADLIDALIKRYGAHVGAKSGDFSMTPLHLASWHGHLMAVQRLVVADPKLIVVRDERGLTPLMLAKQRDVRNQTERHRHVIKWLRKASLHYNSKEKCYVL